MLPVEEIFPEVAMLPDVLRAVVPAMVPLVIALPETFPAVERVGISLSAKVLPEVIRPLASKVTLVALPAVATSGNPMDPLETESPPVVGTFTIPFTVSVASTDPPVSVTQLKLVPSDFKTSPAPQVGSEALANAETFGSLSEVKAV